MTEREVAAFIIGRWQMEHSVAAIRQQLLVLRVNLSDAQILTAVRIWVDSQTENRTYRAKA